MAENSLLRIGKVSSINYPKGTARVTYEDKSDSTSSEMSFLAWEYWMPRIGDQVLVAHLSNGTCAGVILGPVWHNDYRPMEGFKGLYRRELSTTQGKAVERYDDGGGDYSLSITGGIEVNASGGITLTTGGSTIQMMPDGNIIIMASQELTINAPKVHIMGETTIDKKVAAKKNVVVSLGTSVGGDLTVYGEVTGKKGITAEGDVVADKAAKISLTNHTHKSAQPGNSSSAPEQ